VEYWVCYDIADDHRRQRLSDALLDYGMRVQESVFHCLLDAHLAEEMLARVGRIVEEHTDKVHVLAMCDSCAGRTKMFGIAKKAEDREYLIL
jgi:CRISPR-associated endonuclease Cas2